MNNRFSKKHVLITGGGRGIGFEIAGQFGREGARLTIFDYAKDLLDDATQKLKAEGFDVHPFHVDVSRRTEVVEAVDAAEKLHPSMFSSIMPELPMKLLSSKLKKSNGGESSI